MKHSTFYIGSDMVAVVEGLRDRLGNSVEDADVNLVAFKDRRGNDVQGITLPLLMQHTEAGRYEGPIPTTVQMTPGLYKATIRAQAGGMQGEWEETLVASYRSA